MSENTTAPVTLENAKVGDMLVRVSRRGHKTAVKVDRVTPKTLGVGVDTYRRATGAAVGRTTQSSLRTPNPGELEEMAAEEARVAEARKANEAKAREAMRGRSTGIMQAGIEALEARLKELNSGLFTEATTKEQRLLQRLSWELRDAQRELLSAESDLRSAVDDLRRHAEAVERALDTDTNCWSPSSRVEDVRALDEHRMAVARRGVGLVRSLVCIALGADFDELIAPMAANPIEVISGEPELHEG